MLHDFLLYKYCDSPEERGKRVRHVRDHLLHITREEFCQGTKLTTQTLKVWELAMGGGLTKSGAEKFSSRARELNIYCNVHWLLFGIGRPATVITRDSDIHEEDEDHIAKEIMLFQEMDNSLTAVVKDDTMVPHLFPGNYVGGIICPHINKSIGKESIIIDKNSNYFIGILEDNNKNGLYNINRINENPILAKKIITNVDVKTIAPIVWIRKVCSSDYL